MPEIPMTQPDPRALVAEAVASVARELRLWWSFDDRQQHTHSWHTREDFIERALPDLMDNALTAALDRAERAERDLAEAVGLLRRQHESEDDECPDCRDVTAFLSRHAPAQEAP